MKKVICTMFIAALSLSAFSATAATTSASQISKLMDTNGDNIISKEEYMAYHEQAFDNMKQVEGGVGINTMTTSMRTAYYRNSMNNKPMGTTTGKSTNGSTDDTKMDMPINGTHTGTNN